MKQRAVCVILAMFLLLVGLASAGNEVPVTKHDLGDGYECYYPSTIPANASTDWVTLMPPMMVSETVGMMAIGNPDNDGEFFILYFSAVLEDYLIGIAVVMGDAEHHYLCTNPVFGSERYVEVTEEVLTYEIDGHTGIKPSSI